MKYVVAVKQVPDTASVTVDGNGSLVRTGVPSILNPYCEYALCRVLDSRSPGDEVVVFTMGPPQAEQALRRCLALGADYAYLLTDRAFAGSDVYATSRVVSSFVSSYHPDADLLVFGRQAVDGDTGQVPFETAGLLGVQQFAYASSFMSDGDGFTVVQDYGDVIRTTRAPRGSVVSFGGVDPNGRLPSISGMLRAGASDVRTVSASDLGLDPASVGLKGSRTRIVRTGQESGVRRGMRSQVKSPATAAEYILRQAGIM